MPTAGILKAWQSSDRRAIGKAPSDREYSVLFVKWIKSLTYKFILLFALDANSSSWVAIISVIFSDST